MITKIVLDEKNRMLRAGFGLHDGRVLPHRPVEGRIPLE